MAGYGQWSVAQQGAAGWGQQQQQPQVQSKDVTLVVTGCTHATVGGIVRGSFQLLGENHGKPTYKKDGQVNGLDVMSYYWDERDGPGFCGWWFGPKVGGDQVWAYHTDKTAAIPPQSGWKVPYDGPVDPTFAIQYKPKGQQAQQQQAWGQQQQQQQQWGQQQQPQAQWGQQQQPQAQWGQQQQQQQKMEEQRRQLEELKKTQMQTQQAKMQENQMKLQQANAQRMQDQKLKMEQMRAQQQELMAKRAEEQKKKEADMAAKKLEQAGVLKVRSAIQKFRTSTPTNFEDNKKELETVLDKEQISVGSQLAQITKEVEAAVTQVQQRIEQAAKTQAAAKEKQEAELARRKELKEKAESLLGDLEKLVAKAEKGATGTAEKAEPLMGDKEMKVAEIEACASAVEEAGKDALVLVQACTDFTAKEGAAIRNTPAIQGEPPATCTADFNKLQGRINAAKATTGSTLTKAKAFKATRVKKATAKATYDKTFVAFKKFDSDKDGKLSRREIQAYAKGQHAFNMPTETLDKICGTLIKDGSKGVEKELFHKMRIMIGVAREAALDAKRRLAKEERAQEIEKLKEQMQASIKKAGDLITAATETTTTADKLVAALNVGKATKTAMEMLAQADEADSAIEASKTSLQVAKEAVTALKSDEAELKGFVSSEVKKLHNSLSPVEQKKSKAVGASTTFRAFANRKNTLELEKLKADGLATIFHHQGSKKLTSASVYDAFDKKKKGKVEESAFVAFFKTCDIAEDTTRMSEADSARLFVCLDADAKGSITKEQFMNLTRKFMKVLKASVMTEDTSTKSTPMRRLEVGEVFEVLTGPTDAEGEEIKRIKVKSMEDNLEGWVTPVGNRGTVFMEDGGNKFKVVKDTILTADFEIGKASGTPDRKLKLGEILEVREWAKKEEVSGLMRMKVQVKSDGQVGFVTSVGNTGIAFVVAI